MTIRDFLQKYKIVMYPIFFPIIFFPPHIAPFLHLSPCPWGTLCTSRYTGYIKGMYSLYRMHKCKFKEMIDNEYTGLFFHFSAESQGEIEVKDPCACESLVEFQQVTMSTLDQLNQKHILYIFIRTDPLNNMLSFQRMQIHHAALQRNSSRLQTYNWRLTHYHNKLRGLTEAPLYRKSPYCVCWSDWPLWFGSSHKPLWPHASMALCFRSLTQHHSSKLKRVLVPCLRPETDVSELLDADARLHWIHLTRIWWDYEGKMLLALIV